ncbi:hypothetical protein ACTQ45_13225 [Fundicoccus sp. Sow4_D5]|uniref:DUF1659 domain-containing protein n=1 Tax=Fundicoccus sp. Sow4_D5 TaxID=3438782 RepID=UPI003F8F38DE
MKEFKDAKLQFKSVDELTEKVNSFTLGNIKQDTSASEAHVVRDAIQTLTDKPLGKTYIVETSELI